MYFARMSAESSRNAETIRVIFRGVFEYAIGNNLLQANPMRAVVVQRHERKCGQALTRQQLEKFKEDIKARPTYRLPFLIFLYTGVRRSGFGSLEFDFEGGFVKVRNAKLKRHQTNYFREIPILPQLYELREEIERGEWKAVYIDEVGKAFPKLVEGGLTGFAIRSRLTVVCRLRKKWSIFGAVTSSGTRRRTGSICISRKKTNSKRLKISDIKGDFEVFLLKTLLKNPKKKKKSKAKNVNFSNNRAVNGSEKALSRLKSPKRAFAGDPFEVKDELFTCSNVTVLLCPL